MCSVPRCLFVRCIYSDPTGQNETHNLGRRNRLRHASAAQNLKKLADLKPKTLAIMHGSSFTGDCARVLDDLNVMLREVFGRQK